MINISDNEVRTRLGLLSWIRTILPGASIEEDNEGQLVIFTNVTEIDGEVHDMDSLEVNGFEILGEEKITND